MRPKILCLDDESSILDSLERILRHDFTILRAENVAAALDLLKKHDDIAVVLSDHRMQGGSGLEFLEQVRLHKPNAVRAVLSGFMDAKEMMNAVNSGLLHRFIVKPWDNDYLRLQMLEAVKNHNMLLEKDRLERLAITDPITQLTNHRYFQDRLKVELDRAARHSRPLSLIMADIDHFKKFNDQFGHPHGDRMLFQVGRRLLEQVRNIDVVSRYGGEEFAILAPDTPLDMAIKVAERIRSSFSNEPFQGPGDRPVSVTLSLGVASFPEHASDGPQLVSAADQALYRAKGQGRNQTVVALSP